MAFAQFIENKGQMDAAILYYKPVTSGNVLVSERGISYLFYDNSQFQHLYETYHNHEKQNKKSSTGPLVLKYHSVEQQFIGGNIKSNQLSVDRPAKHYLNYFLGNDKSKWAGNVHLYNRLVISNLYKGIDLELLSNGLELKYNFICHPGSDPSQIKIKYNGADALKLNGKALEIKTSVINYTETIPASYLLSSMDASGQMDSVAVKMVLEGDVIRFANLPAGFKNSGKVLVIDPKLIFSTYSGTTADNFGFTATYDDAGNLYAGGITTSPYTQIPDGHYPTTPGAFSQTYNGGIDLGFPYHFPCDITLSKYSSDGSTLMYATYLGGFSNEFPHSIVVDKSGNLIVLGSTFSDNYPTTIGCYESFKSGNADIIITKFNPTGTALIGSTFYGGSQSDGLNESTYTNYFYADNFRGDVIVDTDGSILGVISTFSDDIEIKNGFKSSKNQDIQQGIIFKFNPNVSALQWSSYVGGDNDAALYSIDIDKNHDIFVSGGIAGTGLKTTSGTIATTYKGGKCDGFIAKISSDGQTLMKATYYGTTAYDQIMSLEIDNNDRIYVVGQTEGAMPVKGNVYANPNSGQFVAMLDHDLTTVLYATTFGTGDGLPDITINAFMVDQCRRIFISGWGGMSSSKYFSSTKKMPVTTDALQPNTDGSDFYIVVFDKNFKKLVYATFFGGTKTGDHVDGGTSRWDKKGVIYQSVCSSCPQGTQVGPISDFPTSAGAYAEKNISPRCSNAAFKFSVENLNLKPELKDTFFEVGALDTLTFKYTITDPDEDTINVGLHLLDDFGMILKCPLQYQQEAKVDVDFSWTPKCWHIGDTLRISVDAKDRGCPDFKSNAAMIKIKVNPPPVLDPPKTLCLVFKQNDYLFLSWDAIPVSKYFAFMVLYKVLPNGTTLALDTIRNEGAGSFLDQSVSNPRSQNYSYYIVVFNKCKMAGNQSYTISSLQELNSPIPPTIMITATVVGNKDVSIHWLKSKEPDFGSYSIYRSTNKPALSYQYLTSTVDTFYIDKKVDVQTQSFCYAVVVNDNCGHSSTKSNDACNIVLTGVSKPFYHVLDWQPYRHWDAGVMNYTLERSVDTGSLRPIVSVLANKLTYDDHALDYDWGGYWYSVVANESFKGFGATSRSNSIYLIQPPLLHVPNAFTKNGDQLNETWGFVPVFVKTYRMQVFNRWGEKVFDSENKKEDWDGNFLEETKGPEVFIWQVTYTGWDHSRHYQKGTVTVVK